VFTRSGSVWTQQQKLIGLDTAAGNQFGCCVGLDYYGDLAVVGSQSCIISGVVGAGAAYVFTRSGGVWTQQQKIYASDPKNSAHFGNSVFMSSDSRTVAIGAYNDTTNGGDQTMDTGAGAAYSFIRTSSSWTQQGKLLPSDPAAGDNFSDEVTIAGTGRIYIAGSTFKDSEFTDSGAAYIFVKPPAGWVQKKKLLPADPSANQEFGHGAIISKNGSTVAIGARGDNSHTGAVYIFSKW
jgi:hypothetical protein